jgi:hypothetical protein
MALRVELTLPGAECGLRSAISATVQRVDGAWVMGPVHLNGAQVEAHVGERPELRALLEAGLQRSVEDVPVRLPMQGRPGQQRTTEGGPLE